MRVCASRSSQAKTEYILLVVVVAILGIAFATDFGHRLVSRFSGAGEERSAITPSHGSGPTDLTGGGVASPMPSSGGNRSVGKSSGGPTLPRGDGGGKGGSPLNYTGTPNRPAPGGGGTPQAPMTTAQKWTAAQDILKKTWIGRKYLKQFKKHNMKLQWLPGKQGKYRHATKTVYQGTGYSPLDMASTFVHEMTHAENARTGRTGNWTTDTRPNYIKKMLEDETRAVRNEVAFRMSYALSLKRKGLPESEAYGFNRVYVSKYWSTAAASKKAKPNASDAYHRAVADREVNKMIKKNFQSGFYKTSTNNVTYPAYYGSGWDSHPSRQGNNAGAGS